LKEEKLINLLKKKSLKEVEKCLVFNYLNEKKIVHKNQKIISDFLGDVGEDELLIKDFNCSSIEELSKLFESLIAAKNKEENGAVYTPSRVVSRMCQINKLKENSIILEPSVGGFNS
jgi:type I restriction-modification system DNA methylase subunit